MTGQSIRRPSRVNSEQRGRRNQEVDGGVSKIIGGGAPESDLQSVHVSLEKVLIKVATTAPEGITSKFKIGIQPGFEKYEAGNSGERE